MLRKLTTPYTDVRYALVITKTEDQVRTTRILVESREGGLKK